MPKTSYICNCNVIHEDIVNDVKSKMQPKDDYIQLASLFKLFGDGTRVQILHALEQSEMCVCDLAVLLGVTKSAISHQLKLSGNRYAGTGTGRRCKRNQTVWRRDSGQCRDQSSSGCQRSCG